MEKTPFILGHEPIGGRPNIATRLKEIRKDPLASLFLWLDKGKAELLSNPLSRYMDAYWFYYLSLSRYLPEMSIAARYSKGPAWVLRSGGRQKFTQVEGRLAKQRRQVAPFLEYDLVNCLIHTRILLDRVVGLSQFFLTGPRLPSFTSFNDHKKFFLKLSGPFGAHEQYAEHIRKATDWFEMPLKAVRDKFVVHAAPKHLRFMGYPSGGYELDLNIMLPNGQDTQKPLASVTMISVNALRLSYQVEEFLTWFCEYGLKALQHESN